MIAKFKRMEDKQNVMDNKNRLSKSANHRKVGIDHERSVDERLYQANLKVLFDAMGKDKVVLKGRRLLSAKEGKGR